ncbi:MAG TPA: hypothetical protein VN107_05840, partial [Microbacterium sp.]|nr:hypothetical protein [Microbacterium sp.]
MREHDVEPVVQLEVVKPVAAEPSAPVMVEPVAVAEPVVAEPVPESAAKPAAAKTAEPRIDEFERAAQLFSFTGENATISTTSAGPVSPVATTSTADGAAPHA